MRYLGIVSILVLASGSAMSQAKEKYETVPDHVALVAIASQKNSPLKIEDPTFLKRVGQPGVLFIYKLRNVSTKPIAWVSVMIQYSSGSARNSTPVPRVRKVLLPNETLEAASEPIDYEVAGVYKPEKKTGQTAEELQALVLLLVERVDFTDGSVWEGSKVSDALSRDLEDIR